MPNDDDGQDHVFRFIPLKEVDSNATFGEVAAPKVLHDCDYRVVDRQKHRACLKVSGYEVIGRARGDLGGKLWRERSPTSKDMIFCYIF